MPWSCAKCGLSERKGTVRVGWVCHHCGLPLCEKDRQIITDDAFDTGSPLSSVQAAHCDDCLRRFHPVLLQPGTS